MKCPDFQNFSFETLAQAWENRKALRQRWEGFVNTYPALREVGLDSPQNALFLLWPVLWGFFASFGEGGFFSFLLAFILSISLWRSHCFYSECVAEKEGKSTSSPVVLLIFLVFSLILAWLLSPLVLFLVIFWLVLGAVYPYLFKIIWWPQVYAGLLLGIWPVLIGQAVGGKIGFSVIFLLVAAFFWMLAAETTKADAHKREDLKSSLKSIVLWLGERSISFVTGCLVLAFAFFVLAGISLDANGLFYGALMLAQFLLMRNSLISGEKETKKAHTEAVTTLFYAGGLITAGLWLGI